MDLTTAYEAIFERVVTLASDLTDEEAQTTVIPTPDWTVKDTIAHMVGAADDVLTGNLDGFGSDAWTAAHVEARRDRALEAVCREWTDLLPAFTSLLEETGDAYLRLISGSWTHEQDIRGSLGLRGVGDTGGMSATLELVGDIGPRLEEAGVAGLEIWTPDKTWTIGVVDARLSTTGYVLARLMYGRRSENQIRALEWDGDPSPYVRLLGQYAPAPVDIID